MPTPLSSLVSSIQCVTNWTAAAAVVAGLSNALQNQNSFTVNTALGTSKTDTQANGADTLYVATSQIAASANTTINLNSYTDAAGQTGVSAVRIKGWFIKNLVAADYSTIVTPASSVTIGNAATPFPFNLNTATTTFTLNAGEWVAFASPSTTGISTSGANNVKIVNNDGSNTAYVLCVFIGGTA